MSFVVDWIKRIIYPDSYNGERYIAALREKHRIDIGEDCVVWSPNQTYIDVTRPHMLHIGRRVKIARNVTVLCHDYSRSVLCEMESGGNVGEAGFTFIGDNVFIGVNSTILMGAHIGSNSIVGAGSVVSGRFPESVVIAGNPAKVVCTTQELYARRKAKEIESARRYAREWKQKYGRYPDAFEMTNAFAWLYLPHTVETLQQYPKLFALKGVDKEAMLQCFLSSEPAYESFQAFLADCENHPGGEAHAVQ